VAQDYAQGPHLASQGRRPGFFGAQNNLGVLYRDGKGVTQDYIIAHMWFNLAASRAADTATHDGAAKNRDLVAAKMTPPQIAEAQRMAGEWVPKK
jgi:uncharacterized protein